MTRPTTPLLAATLLAASLPCIQPALAAADPESCSTVHFSDVGWSDITVTTAVTRYVLSELGYVTKVHRLSAKDTYKALSEGKVDVFLPTSDFHERARVRKVVAYLGDQQVTVWDAESLCVFKIMFFRRKDLADVERILRVQGENLDREWVAQQLEELFGKRDPRVSEFAALCAEVSG